MMSQMQSTTVVNAGRCINVQDEIFGAKQMETDPSVKSFLVLSSGRSRVITPSPMSLVHCQCMWSTLPQTLCESQPREEGTGLLRFQRRFLMTTPSLCKLAHLSASWEDAVEISFRGSSGLTFECLPDPLNASAGLSLSPTQW